MPFDADKMLLQAGGFPPDARALVRSVAFSVLPLPCKHACFFGQRRNTEFSQAEVNLEMWRGDSSLFPCSMLALPACTTAAPAPWKVLSDGLAVL